MYYAFFTINLSSVTTRYFLNYGTFQDPSKRFGASLGALSSGRTGIMVMGTTNLQLAVVIATRYSAARRQFGPENTRGAEQSVIEYQMQQCRLFPYLAAAYVHHALSMSFFQASRSLKS